MKGLSETSGRPFPPLPQHNPQQAAKNALAGVRQQSPEQLEWLGARSRGRDWRLDVLDDVLALNIDDGTVRTSNGQPVRACWQGLAMHYLATSSRPPEAAPQLTFASLPGGRTYASVYQQRVIGRLCRTVGGDAETLGRAAGDLGAKAVDEGDLAFDFQAFPRVRLRLVWYAGDEELPPSAVLLLPSNIDAFLPIEDIVVFSEEIVSRLQGKPF